MGLCTPFFGVPLVPYVLCVPYVLFEKKRKKAVPGYRTPKTATRLEMTYSANKPHHAKNKPRRSG